MKEHGVGNILQQEIGKIVQRSYSSNKIHFTIRLYQETLLQTHH